MQSDFTEIVFNQNHRLESRGIQALHGLRLVLLAIVLSVAWLAAFLLLSFVSVPDALYNTLAVAMPVTGFVAFCTGAYATWLVVDALGWAKFLSFAIIASFLIPYFRLFALLVIAALALDLVFKSGYRITLFGKPVKRPEPLRPL